MQLCALLLLTIAVAHASVTVTRTSNDEPHPSVMEIEVQLPFLNTKVRIPLTRTDAFEDIPMTVMENGVSRTFSSRQAHHESHSHYRDIESQSVISVRHVNGKRQLSGNVMHEGTSYFLEPIGDSEHRVTKNAMKPDRIMAKQVDRKKIFKVLSRRKRQSNTRPTRYTIELHLLLDSSVWSTFTTLYGTDSTAMTELLFYYTHILNGIDTAYRNIGSLPLSISCIGITISQSASNDTWIPISSLDGDDILRTMKKYVTGKTTDHFMAFTRKKMVSGYEKKPLHGMAYVGGICTDFRVSINLDNGLRSWSTAAHELAHNLGAWDDGEGNDCSAGSKYLMAPTSVVYDLSDVANSYRFSTCAVYFMSRYIHSLGSECCLLSAQGSRLPELSSSNQRVGARLTLDQVCRLADPDGPGKFHLTSNAASEPASICSSIHCELPAGRGTFYDDGLRAPVGTPCGNRKSCNWNGECTADAFVPAVRDEACLFRAADDASNPTRCQQPSHDLVN